MFPEPKNEPVKPYQPGSPERSSLKAELARMSSECAEIPAVINGEKLRSGTPRDVVSPHDRQRVLGRAFSASAKDDERAIQAAEAARPEWAALPLAERASVLLRAADLLAGPWRDKLNAATMLGQSKTAYQAEIDSACELTDFWRYNLTYMHRLMSEQPVSSPGIWNRLEYRPLEGFVFAVAPFNF